MPHGVYAQCPCCGKIALGSDYIDKLFGYRKIREGVIIPQSYCRDCRKKNYKSKEIKDNEKC